MANKLTKANLVEEMLLLLQTFNKSNMVLDSETVHSDALPDFKGAPPSRKIYIGFLHWTIAANGGKKLKFPSNWISYTVNDLAEFIMSKQ